MTNYAGHIVKHDDDWGLGQIDIETIKKMILVGDNIGLTFTFAKKVTAMDDTTGEEQTVKSDKGYLFAYPSDHRDLTDFWAEVDKNGGQHDRIQRRNNEKGGRERETQQLCP